MAQTSSRLQALQARFQQKQMQEKEQKMLQIYDQRQQRAYQVIQRGSAGSTGSVSQVHTVMRTTTTTHPTGNPQGGRVRQMFDERRQTTVKGIDRSYPLEPLDNKPVRHIVESSSHVSTNQHPNKNVVRQTVTITKRVIKSDINSNLDGKQQIISYPEEVSKVSFGNHNRNGKYHDAGYDRGGSPTRNGVHIEEIVDNDTIERNRMLAKIHLMKYDENLRNRVNNDLNNEIFPEDLMIDIPEKLPRKRITKKLSDAEARLEKFKNAMNKKSNTIATTSINRSELRKRSDPMFTTSKTNSRDSKPNSKLTEVVKVRRSAAERSPSPDPIRSPPATTRRRSSPSITKVVKHYSPGSPIQTKKVELMQEKPCTGTQLTRTVQSGIEIRDTNVIIQDRPSSDPVDRKPPNVTADTPTGRLFPTSPTNSTDNTIKRDSAGSKSREATSIRKSLQATTKDHGASRTVNTRSAAKDINRADDVKTLSRSDPPPRTNNMKSPTSSPVVTKNLKSSMTDIDGNSEEKMPAVIRGSTPTKFHTERPSTPQNRQQSYSTTRSPSPRPTSTLSSASSTTTSARRTPSRKSPVRQMASEAKHSARSAGLTSNTKGVSSVKNGPSTQSSGTLVACKICGRRFAQDRVSLHEKICAKTGQKKRKQFDTVLHRVQGTELEAFAKKGSPAGKQADRRVRKPEVKAKSNWRRKHEDFINAIRSAKQVQAHLAAGGKLSDLPPPPASDTSDYIQCPHCGRKFNQGAADRHIPKCANMMHNKPNPRAPPKPKR